MPSPDVMHLTTGERRESRVLVEAGLARGWWWLVVGIALAVTFALDHFSGRAPLQHLYYLPIIAASVKLGRPGAFLATLTAIGLYHLANPHLLTLQYAELDLVQISLFIAVGATATKLAHDARRLRHFATTDDLTGLHNLRSFEIHLEELVRHTRPAGSLALMVLDVDHLKSLNDVHGHITGAEAVRTVGRLIAEVAPPEAVACRYGGDEFVIAVPSCPPARARTIADALRSAVESCAPVLAGANFPAGTITISIGIASRTLEPSTAAAAVELGEDLFRAADDALYAAKAAGRNRVALAP